MSTELATKYLPYVDELFSQESKKSILTNEDFDFDGAKTVKLYKVNTAEMNDYGRTGATGSNWPLPTWRELARQLPLKKTDHSHS